MINEKNTKGKRESTKTERQRFASVQPLTSHHARKNPDGDSVARISHLEHEGFFKLD
jgi:hypothetical protein